MKLCTRSLKAEDVESTVFVHSGSPLLKIKYKPLDISVSVRIVNNNLSGAWIDALRRINKQLDKIIAEVEKLII
jgi:hypothetical protein